MLTRSSYRDVGVEIRDKVTYPPPVLTLLPSEHGAELHGALLLYTHTNPQEHGSFRKKQITHSIPLFFVFAYHQAGEAHMKLFQIHILSYGNKELPKSGRRCGFPVSPPTPDSMPLPSFERCGFLAIKRKCNSLRYGFWLLTKEALYGQEIVVA